MKYHVANDERYPLSIFREIYLLVLCGTTGVETINKMEWHSVEIVE